MENVNNDLKIIELKGNNFKKIKVIVIKPDDNLVLLTGKNSQGKSSAIDLIIATLCGKDNKMIPQPIRKGQTHADSRIDLGDFIVTCKWTEKGKYLKVTSKEGMSYPSPQAILDGLVGELSFDPLAFSNMPEKEQTELLLRLAGLDFKDIDLKIDRLVEDRRIQGQKVKLLNGEREEITIKDLPEKEISIGELNKELEEALNHNLKYESLVDRNSGYLEEIKKLEERIGLLKSYLKENIGWLEGKIKISTEGIKLKIEKAEGINDQIKARERNKKADDSFKYELSIYEKQTAKIEEFRISKTTALQQAKFPLTNLKVTPTGIFFNDIPIKQLSSSEDLKVSMAIAMALNSKLKVILVKDASLLDEDNKKIIRELAGERGYQVWLECVDSTGEIGFYFVEGEIQSINGEEVVNEN